jgi:hypothetical protein
VTPATSHDFAEIAAELRKLFPGGTVHHEGGGAAPEHLTVSFGDEERTYVCGDANATWGADFYTTRRDLEEGIPARDGCLDSHLPVHVTDPWTVALNLAAAISRREQEGV